MIWLYLSVIIINGVLFFFNMGNDMYTEALFNILCVAICYIGLNIKELK